MVDTEPREDQEKTKKRGKGMSESEFDDFDIGPQVDEIEPNEHVHVCAFCGMTASSRNEAIDSGWEPDAWSEACQDSIGPICSECSDKIETPEPFDRRVKPEHDSTGLKDKGTLGYA